MKPRPITPKFPRPLGATPAQDARLATLAALERRGCVPTCDHTCHRPRHAAGALTGFLGSAVRDDSTWGAGRHGARAVAPSLLSCLGWRMLDASAMGFLRAAFVVLWVEDRFVRLVRWIGGRS